MRVIDPDNRRSCPSWPLQNVIMGNTSTSQTPLLGENDPPVYNIVNPDSESPLLLVCEHAGQAIPEKLQDLGLSQQELSLHIAWDIGASALCHQIANSLGCCAILQNYSRLVIDCNRPPQANDAMPSVSDGVTIPGNSALSDEMKTERVSSIFEPFQASVSNILEIKNIRYALSIHSFTPKFQGQSRPWDIGFLFRSDNKSSQQLAAFIHVENPGLNIGMNEPYKIDDTSDWFVPRHCEPRRIAHSLIEVRNDHLIDQAGQQEWAKKLSSAINDWISQR